MKKLQDILYRAGITAVNGSLDLPIEAIASDSRKVVANSLFVAVKGTQVDGHRFINKAEELGAIAIVCEEFPGTLSKKVTYIKVKNSAVALGYIASNFFDNPSGKLKLVGVTGTNGKTTTVTLLFNLMESLGYKCGLLSTIQNKIHQTVIPATHTTPDAISLNMLLAEMVEAGCGYVFMEVSSHAIHQHRIAGLYFAGAVFTNLTHDHLDYHKTFKEYLQAKKRFFDDLPSGAFALVNMDDKNGRVMLQNTAAKKYGYALKNMADFKARVLESRFDSTILSIDGHQFYTMMVGTFNAYNQLAVYATARLLGQDAGEVLLKMSTLKGAAGRFEVIRSKNNITAIVDYAHTPDALENVLKTINTIRTGNEQLITVVGAGGNRDKEKRPKMARIASLLSTRVIITSDNPRDEEPQAIIDDMLEGVDVAKKMSVVAIVNRKEAIHTAVMLAQPGDIILVAGKGHETYQEIKGVKYPFDDKKVLTELFDNL
ncbi:MAG: UDP-N-acetylmuramoyl-L-alanyl-D-glutamate--2,6-diaminopimelate ligase [Bacteroidetes bacterium]|nr:MAG: UDP-N-acetylmuramoyl-L-alanyl-D-glutamate--2,6-diaminopimelate ligase [Bacteroidota bacterium]